MKKMVAVMNKSCPMGVVMNALGHMAIGLGARVGKEKIEVVDYVDNDDTVYPDISKLPFIILRANGNKIKTLEQEARLAGVEVSCFTDTMTEGGWEEQLERTRSTKRDELAFYGVVLIGEEAVITELTRKFSLWK